jgi:hypothetical protein
MDHFIKLFCSNCGGDMKVYDDMDRFFCGHCGAGIEAQRRDGTVVLKVAGPPTQRPETTLTTNAEQKKWGYLIGICLVALGFTLVRSGISFLFGLCMLLGGFVAISYARRMGKRVSARR